MVKQVAHQPQIANLVYGDRMGNNSQGDGWKYRGRGLLQITGRENYTKCGTALKLDLVSTPELLTQRATRGPFGGMVLHVTRLSPLFGDVERVTQIINGGKTALKTAVNVTPQLKPHWCEVSMGLEMIIGLIVAALAAIAGAGLGKSRGTSIAQKQKADQRRTEERAAATEAVAELRVETTKGARDVQQTVSHMPNDDVDRELRGNWTRKG